MYEESRLTNVHASRCLSWAFKTVSTSLATYDAGTTNNGPPRLESHEHCTLSRPKNKTENRAKIEVLQVTDYRWEKQVETSHTGELRTNRVYERKSPSINRGRSWVRCASVTARYGKLSVRLCESVCRLRRLPQIVTAKWWPRKPKTSVMTWLFLGCFLA